MSAEPEVSFGELFAPLRRQARFIAPGLGLSAFVVIALALLWPAQYEGVGTLTVAPAPRQLEYSDVSWSSSLTWQPMRERNERPASTSGAPVPAYRRALRSFADNIAAVPDPLVSRVAGHVTPLASNGRTDIATLTNDDAIVSVRVSDVASSDSEAVRVVEGIAERMRSGLTTGLAREHIDRAVGESMVLERRAAREQVAVVEWNKQLDRLVSELEPIARKGGGAAREGFVDPSRGGYVFLPPAVQVQAVRAAQANNRQAAHVAQQTQALHSSRVKLLEGLDDDIEAEVRKNGGYCADVPALVGAALDRFLSGQLSASAIGAQLRLEIESWAEQLAMFHAATRLTQRPATKALSKAPLVGGVAAVLFLVVLALAVLRDAWGGSRRRPNHISELAVR